MPCPVQLQGRQDGRSPNSIAIDFSFRRKTRVKLGGNILAPQNSNSWRQKCIDCSQPARCRHSLVWKIDMRALRERVNASVSAAGAMNARFNPSDPADGAFQVILNGGAMCLALPSGESCAVVGNDQFQPRRHFTLRRSFGMVRQFVLPIQITLQNHLRCDLIDIPARRARFSSAFLQSAMRRGSR